MTTFIVRRLLLSLVVLIIMTIVVFLALRLLPGDPIYMIMSSGEMSNVTIEQIEAIRHQYGLDKPLIAQYFGWLGGIVHGDFGTSIVQNQPVLNEIGRRIPITLNLSVVALCFSALVGIPAGIICALRRGKIIDTVVTFFTNIGITVPAFWLGLMLIYLFSLTLHWLPVQGYTSPFENPVQNLRQSALPIFCLCIAPIAMITRQTRSNMLEVTRQDYIRTAWSKGLSERIIVIRHMLKNTLIPVITLMGITTSNIIGGSVVIETVFNIPGMGRMAVNAVFAHDYPVVQGTVLLIAITVLLVNLIVDISYGWFDPRIRYA